MINDKKKKIHKAENVTIIMSVEKGGRKLNRLRRHR